MAINTAAKRRSSAAARRMPWMRRFATAPDGSVSQADRQQGAWVYVGILSSTIEELQITSIVGGWYIPGSAVGERYAAGIVPNVNGLAAESYAAGAVVAEGRFK